MQRVVEEIAQQNEKANDIMEQQEEMISDFRTKMEEASEKIKNKILEKGRQGFHTVNISFSSQFFQGSVADYGTLTVITRG